MIKTISVLVISLFLFSACDKIEMPHYIITPEVEIIDTFPALNRSSVYRKILIEEYTGHRCQNCPVAHAKIVELSSLFGDTLVAVCIHAGAFAQPLGSKLYTYDFRTVEGTKLYDDFIINFVPSAVINRIKFEENKWEVQSEQWQNTIQSVARTVYAGIQIQTKITGSVLTVGTKTTMLSAYSSPLHLSIFLIEDDIIKPQKYFNNDIEDYQHNHVLRASFNGVYGSPLTPDGILTKDSAYIRGYNLDFKEKDWKISNTFVVIVLHDPKNKEVLQVEVKAT